MHGAEVDPAVTGKDFAPDGAIDRPRVAFGVRFGKRNADLHRSAGVDRVEIAEQRLAHRHHIDQVIEDGTEIFFTAHLVQTGRVAFSGRRFDQQRGTHQEGRDVYFCRPAIDLTPGDFRQARYGGLGAEVALLIRYGDHRTEVTGAGIDLLRAEGSVDIVAPRRFIADVRRQQPLDLRFDIFRLPHRRLRGFLAATTRQHQCGDQCQTLQNRGG